MSIFGALTTAISGLTSQSKALGNISDNVANSQTVGFKRVDTNFVSYITVSSNVENAPGTVIARPGYTNDVQGPTQTSDNPLALAIGGQGMFSVALANGTTGANNTLPTFDERQFFTRAGNFSQDANGYLVNSSGYFLQGWIVDPTTSTLNRTQVQPIQVSQQTYNPIPTTSMNLSANLPSNALNTDDFTTQTLVYDSLGNQHQMSLHFNKNPAAAGTNPWTMTMSAAGDANSATPVAVTLNFNDGSNPANPSGTISAISGGGTDVNGASLSAPTNFALVPGTTGTDAAFSFDANFGQGTQTLTFSLGTFNQSINGVTQFAGGGAAGSDAQLSVRDFAQNGVALGSYSGLSIRTNGDVAVNYDNGQSRVLARVPIVTFKDVDKLQRLDGQAFMRTVESGEASVTDAASNGAGKLVTGSIENSNVDIATEFTKMIVAQRAYSANTKVVTTADQMLSDTINMAR
jgi:flagellar hook protein FlgE